MGYVGAELKEDASVVELLNQQFGDVTPPMHVPKEGSPNYIIYNFGHDFTGEKDSPLSAIAAFGSTTFGQQRENFCRPFFSTPPRGSAGAPG